MEEFNDFMELNKKSWNNRTPNHIQSDFYDVKGFLAGNSTLNDIEISLLGNIKHKKTLHLQCHFGLDTLSLQRMGADLTGVDFSGEAIEKAKELTRITNLKCRFIESDIYQLKHNLNDSFDVIFTSYGVLNWLNDLNLWADIIQHFLNPGGRLILVEFHPMIWMFDDDMKDLTYSYFNQNPIQEIEYGTYTNPEAPLQTENVTWNHSLSEVFQSLLQQNLQIECFEEYDYSPYNIFKNSIKLADNNYQIKHVQGKIPLVYAVRANKPL